MSKLFKFVSRIYSLVFKGECVLALFEIAKRMPNWLFRYNKADILYTENFIFPAKLNPDVRVKIADYSDIDEIIRISGVNSEHIKNMMDNGAKCFIASFKDEPPMTVTWSANGNTFVKGLAFFHDVGPDGYYSYNNFTLPDGRGKGLYLKAQCEKIKYEMDRGGLQFYATIEFTNRYSYSLYDRLGYHPILRITYFKIFAVNFCHVKDVENGKTETRIVTGLQETDVTVI